MNKSLMISMKPQHALNISNGDKDRELRTWIPKDYVGWVYVYVSKGIKDILYKYKDKYYTQHYLTFTDSVEVLNSKVVFRFWFDVYDDIVYTTANEYVGSNGNTSYDWQIGSFYLDKLQLTYNDILDYGKGKDLYAWHIEQLEVFDEPKSLSEFYKKVEFAWADTGYMNVGGEPIEYHPIEKAPQRSAWVYVNE